MKISKKNISKLILEELSKLTADLVIDHATQEIAGKLSKGFTQEQIKGLSKFELERMIDELITADMLNNMGLDDAHGDKILLGTLAKIQS